MVFIQNYRFEKRSEKNIFKSLHNIKEPRMTDESKKTLIDYVLHAIYCNSILGGYERVDCRKR